MASIQKRANGRWRARFRDEGGREHARHFERKVDAQAWLDEQTARIVRGEWADPRAGRETLRAYATRWQGIQVSSAGTARIVDNALRLHILPRIGDHRIGNIRRSDIQALVKWLEIREIHPANDGEPARTLSAGSIRNIYEVLARVMDAAMQDRVISVSPCRRITLPKDHDNEVEVPSLEDVERVSSALGERWQAIPVVLAGSGLRVGELLGLRLSDVDFLRRTVSVERQRLQSHQIAPLKSRASRRVVPIGQVVIDALAAHLAAYPPTVEALFADELGEPLTYRRWKRLLSDAAKNAEVDLTSHSFRHLSLIHI